MTVLTLQVDEILKQPTKFPIRDRQNLIREQNVFEDLMDILNLLAHFIGSETPQTPDSTPDYHGFSTSLPLRVDTDVDDPKRTRMRKLEDLKERAQMACKAIYFLIEVSFANNHENSMYVARWMDVMIKHIDLDIGSDRCLTQMLDNNEDLLNEKVQNSYVCIVLQQ